MVTGSVGDLVDAWFQPDHATLGVSYAGFLDGLPMWLARGAPGQDKAPAGTPSSADPHLLRFGGTGWPSRRCALTLERALKAGPFSAKTAELASGS